MDIKQKSIEIYPQNLNYQTFKDDHLGGCNVFGDPGTECPKLWKYVVDKYNIKSVLDVGCGFGFHLKYFKDFLNLKVKGIEGSAKVQKLSFFPDEIVAHDYTTGKLILDETYDFCWSVEFVEHVEGQFAENFISNFKNCKYLIITHATPGQGGHHHVNEQSEEYWVNLLEKHGLIFDKEETDKIKELALEDINDFRIWYKTPKETRQKRGVACEYFPSESNPDELHPHVVHNGLFFKNKNLI